MKHWAKEWSWALVMGLAMTAAVYAVARWIGGHTDSEWIDVVMVGTIAFQHGRKWERD